jgi:hypothetical protein
LEHARDFVGALLNNFAAIFFQKGLNERPRRNWRVHHMLREDVRAFGLMAI